MSFLVSLPSGNMDKCPEALAEFEARYAERLAHRKYKQERRAERAKRAAAKAAAHAHTRSPHSAAHGMIQGAFAGAASAHSFEPLATSTPKRKQPESPSRASNNPHAEMNLTLTKRLKLSEKDAVSWSRT